VTQDKTTPLAGIVSKNEQSLEAVRINELIFQSADISNAYLINTAEGAVLVNTGTVMGRQRHRTAFDKVRTGPYRYIVLTQSHPDHFGGVVAFKEAGTQVLAERRFVQTRAYYAAIAPVADPRTFKLWEPVLGDMKAMTRFEEVIPDIEVNDSYTFTLGGRRFDLYSTAGGETVDSLVVHLPEEGIVFTGNLFGPAWMNLPNLYTIRGDKIRSAMEYLRSLERVKALRPKLLITGHGEPISGLQHIQDCLATMHEATRYVHDKTVEGMNAGKDVRTLMREIRLPAHLKVGQLHGKVSWNVRGLWTEYLGWFDYGSTTELYDVPPNAIAADLLELAGGAKALLERAQRYASEAKPLHALHLIEIVLHAEPANREALAAKKLAHERLLEQTSGENLSETMWIKSEILAASRALARAGG
jgi:alkyl sulfatase BDS1-like metallo-beta-lactamase superfamily hydrolase